MRAVEREEIKDMLNCPGLPWGCSGQLLPPKYRLTGRGRRCILSTADTHIYTYIHKHICTHMTHMHTHTYTYGYMQTHTHTYTYKEIAVTCGTTHRETILHPADINMQNLRYTIRAGGMGHTDRHMTRMTQERHVTGAEADTQTHSVNITHPQMCTPGYTEEVPTKENHRTHPDSCTDSTNRTAPCPSLPTTFSCYHGNPMSLQLSLVPGILR